MDKGIAVVVGGEGKKLQRIRENEGKRKKKKYLSKSTQDDIVRRLELLDPKAAHLACQGILLKKTWALTLLKDLIRLLKVYFMTHYMRSLGNNFPFDVTAADSAVWSMWHFIYQPLPTGNVWALHLKHCTAGGCLFPIHYFRGLAVRHAFM